MKIFLHQNVMTRKMELSVILPHGRGTHVAFDYDEDMSPAVAIAGAMRVLADKLDPPPENKD